MKINPRKFLRKILFRCYIPIKKRIWAIWGRKFNVMGQHLNLSPNSSSMRYKGMKLPEKDCNSDIVGYADFVQIHCCCMHLMTIEHSPVVVDIGAHHGIYACILGALIKDKGGVLIAIEPDPTNYSILKENIYLNQLENVVITRQSGIFSYEGKMNLAEHGSQSALGKQKGKKYVEVTIEPFSRIVEEYKIERIDLLIVDTEGAELPILYGIPWEKIKINKIFCELHPYNWEKFGYSSNDFKKFINEQNFRCIDMYCKEHFDFIDKRYIGPCLLLPSYS